MTTRDETIDRDRLQTIIKMYTNKASWKEIRQRCEMWGIATGHMSDKQFSAYVLKHMRKAAGDEWPIVFAERAMPQIVVFQATEPVEDGKTFLARLWLMPRQTRRGIGQWLPYQIGGTTREMVTSEIRKLWLAQSSYLHTDLRRQAQRKAISTETREAVSRALDLLEEVLTDADPVLEEEET